MLRTRAFQDPISSESVRCIERYGPFEILDVQRQKTCITITEVSWEILHHFCTHYVISRKYFGLVLDVLETVSSHTTKTQECIESLVNIRRPPQIHTSPKISQLGNSFRPFPPSPRTMPMPRSVYLAKDSPFRSPKSGNLGPGSGIDRPCSETGKKLKTLCKSIRVERMLVFTCRFSGTRRNPVPITHLVSDQHIP